MSTTGFIGLGRMGKSMALNLCKKGFELMVWDIQSEPMRQLQAQGAKAAQSVAHMAQVCDVVITMLPTASEVQQVALGADGLFAPRASGKVLMDMSTIDPLATDALQAAALACGWSVVDAPVGRLAEHADRAESLFMVGASEADFERVLPLLQAMGTTIHHCGPVGSGGRTKLVNNYVAISLTQVNAEALALSQRFGLDLSKTLSVLLGTSANNGQLRLNLTSKALKGDNTPGFTIDLAHKDMGLVLGAAHAAKVPMPVAATVYESYSQARASAQGGLDFSSLVDVVCDAAGIDRARLPPHWKPD